MPPLPQCASLSPDISFTWQSSVKQNQDKIRRRLERVLSEYDVLDSTRAVQNLLCADVSQSSLQNQYYRQLTKPIWEKERKRKCYRVVNMATLQVLALGSGKEHSSITQLTLTRFFNQLTFSLCIYSINIYVLLLCNYQTLLRGYRLDYSLLHKIEIQNVMNSKKKSQKVSHEHCPLLIAGTEFYYSSYVRCLTTTLQEIKDNLCFREFPFQQYSIEFLNRPLWISYKNPFQDVWKLMIPQISKIQQKQGPIEQ